MIRTSAILLCLVCLAILSVQAQSPVPAARDAQTVTLLTQCAAAMGSSDPLNTFHGSAKMIPAHPNDAQSNLVLRSQGERQMRWDRNPAGGEPETIVTRGAEGTIKQGEKESRMAPWQTAYSRAEHFPAVVCASELERPEMEITYAGLEDVGGAAAHHITITAAAKGESKRADAARRITSEFHIFLDPQSFRIVKTKRWAFSPEAMENRSTLEIYYSDYKQVDGVWMPFTLTYFLDGQKLHDIVFENVQVGVALSDADFSN